MAKKKQATALQPARTAAASVEAGTPTRKHFMQARAVILRAAKAKQHGSGRTVSRELECALERFAGDFFPEADEEDMPAITQRSWLRA